MISEYLLLIICMIILLIVAEKLISINRIKRAKKYFKNFTGIEEIGGFSEVHPYFHFSGDMQGESVLLIHGFSASSSEFRFLAEELKKRNITYYAPMLTGFGIDDFHLLRNIKHQDWLRDVVYGYDLLKKISGKIHLVGHSMGGLLSLHLSTMRTVDKIILTSPYLTIKKDHKPGNTIIQNKYVWNIISYFNPVLSKEKSRSAPRPDDPEVSMRFAIPVFPLSIVRELWALLGKLDYSKIESDKILVIFGKKDTTAIPGEVRKLLSENNVKYTEYEFENCGHNLLEERRHGEVIQKVLEFLDI